MKVPLSVFQHAARANPVLAASALETETEARRVLTNAEVLHPIQVARLLPHCVERLRGLTGGEFLPDDRAREILRSALSQQALHGFAALSPSEAVATFASFDPQRIRALREVGPVSAVEQQRLDGYLDQACQSNSGRGIESLMAAGARLRAPEQGPTAIHDAASAGREQVMPALLAAGMPLAEVMRPDPYGRTPVLLAARAGHAPVIEALQTARVSAEELMKPDARGWTPAHIAALKGQPHAIEALGKAGVTAKELMKPDARGWTPAHIAALEGQPHAIEVLGKAGVTAEELMKPAKDGKTPAHFAALQGDSRVIKALLKAGVTAEELMKPDNDGKTPVDFAHRQGGLDVIEALREAGVAQFRLLAAAAPRAGTAQATAEELMKPGNDGNTPVHFAAQLGHARVLEALRELDVPIPTTWQQVAAGKGPGAAQSAPAQGPVVQGPVM